MTGPPVRTGVAAAARCLALDQHAVLVVAALTQAGIASLVLKGPGLARRLYAENPSQRRYSDVDILVAPADFDRAQGVLAQLGHHDVAGSFPDDEWLWYERSWLREGPVPLTVDLHRGFAGVRDADALWSLLHHTAESLALCGNTVRVPDAAGAALLIGLHAASPGRGRKAMVDLDRGLELLPDRVWTAAASAARVVDAQDAFASGLRRTPAGQERARRLGLDRRAGRVERTAERLDLVLLGRALDAIRAVPGAGAKLNYVRRRLAPTPDFMRRATPLAERGRSGLVLAYLIRPIRLLVPAATSGTGTSRRGGRPGRAGSVRRFIGRRPEDYRVAVWTWRALTRVRADLVSTPLEQIEIARPPRCGPRATGVVRAVLRHRHASCLERSLISQRWHGRQGRPVDLVVGVTAPASGFRAHAWLATDDDAEHSHHTMVEMLRRPTPPSWLDDERSAAVQ